MEGLVNFKYVANALVFSVFGLGVLGIAFKVFDKVTPGNFWKEIIEEHNTALAIIAGAIVLAMGQIIGSAIHG
jgi:uncharacterized membrane protein YjfL (UPF0719 family)